MPETSYGSDGIELAIRRLVRYWPVVVVAVIVGAVASAAYARSTVSAAEYVGIADIRIANTTASPLAPNADVVAAAVVAPSTRESVLADLGADAEGAGEISSAVDAKDKAVVRISAQHEDPEAAKRYAAAVRSVATSTSLTLMSLETDVLRGKIDAYGSELGRVNAALEEARERRQRVEETAIMSLVSQLESQRFSIMQAIRDTEWSLTRLEGTILEYGEPAVEKKSASRSLLVAGAQGGLIGLLAGLGVVLVADRLRGRGAPAA